MKQGKDEAKTACILNIQKFCIHDGPGIRTTVFFKGCPLRCHWCSNPESQKPGVSQEREESMRGKIYTMDEALDICLSDRDFFLESGGGVTLSGGEVLSQANFACELLVSLRAEGIHTALETTGFAPPEVFQSVCKHSDLLLYDLKHYHSAKHCEGTSVPNEQILENLAWAIKTGKEILIRIPVIPGYNNALTDALGFSILLNLLGLKRVQLLPFHQFGQKKYESLSMKYSMNECRNLHPEELEDYRTIFLENGLDCFF